MRAVPFYLVTGFLGSGKTTFVQNFIDQFSTTHRMGIIQNEFSPENVDGALLEQSAASFEMLEVNNGSVFCVCQLSSFVQSLADFIRETHPEIILMETSGLSDPISIGEILMSPELKEKIFLAHIWSIVDAYHFEKLAKNLPRLQHQIMVADKVLINKTDKLDRTDDSIELWIKGLNPFASIESTSYCKTELQDPSHFFLAPVAVRREQQFSAIEKSGRPKMGSFVIKTTREISRAGLEAFLQEIASQTLRIKGLVRMEKGRMVTVQSSFGETGIEDLPDYSGQTELVGLGPEMDTQTIQSRFKWYQSSG
jgi:G3E family GTPase